MKSFSDSLNERTNRYASSEEIKNKIDCIIDEHLKINVDEQVVEDSNLSIDGREELISSLEKLVKFEKIKQQISILEGYKQNPQLLVEKMTIVEDPILANLPKNNDINDEKIQ